MYTGVDSALDWNLVELNANGQRRSILHRTGTASDCDIQRTNFISGSLLTIVTLSVLSYSMIKRLGRFMNSQSTKCI